MSRFPELARLGPLAAEEWDALRSLNVACAQLRHEWEAAQVRASGALLALDLAEQHAGGDALQRYHQAAVGEVATLAVRYEDRVGSVAWRYASASFVLGVAVGDRLLRGAAPLRREEIVRLSCEPSLGRLKEAAGEPYARMVEAREDNSVEVEQRRDLLALLAGVDRSLSHRRPGADADALISEVSEADEGVDPVWMDALAPMLDAAESVVHWVVYIVHRQAGVHP